MTLRTTDSLGHPEPDQHTGAGDLNRWESSPRRREYGADMCETLVSLHKNHTMTITVEAECRHLVEPALRKLLGADAEKDMHAAELRVAQRATADIAMAASIKLATARQVILAELQRGGMSAQLTLALGAVLDTLPGGAPPAPAPAPAGTAWKCIAAAEPPRLPG